MVGPLNGAMMTETLSNRKGIFCAGVLAALAGENRPWRDSVYRACDRNKCCI